MLNIFNYTEPHIFLKDAWTEKKKRNPSFSLRAWSRRLGFENNSPLSLMLAGKRPIPKKYIPHFVENLGLTSKESFYLETLIDLSRAKSSQQREFYCKRLRALTTTNAIKMHEVESFKLLSDPLHTILLEMTELKDFKEDPKWIQSRLLYKVTTDQINSTLERLFSLNLLKRDEKGRLKKTHQHITNRKDVQDQAVQEFQRDISKIQSELNLALGAGLRDLHGYTLGISVNALPRAKEMIREFIHDFLKEIEATSEKAEETYQLNVQFFGLTQPKNK